MRLTLGLIRAVKRRVPTKDEDESPGSLERVGGRCFYFNEISEDGTFFTMRIDSQKGTARIEYGAW